MSWNDKEARYEGVIMNTYNLCDEPWIRVRYKDGTIIKSGIADVMRDAAKIEDILPPVIRHDEVDLYYVLVMKLLTTIVMSAYYKQETGYAARNLRYLDRIKEQGLYNDVIEKYLEKYHDRFDLLSETQPFLQNVRLKKEFEMVKPGDDSYLTWNPLAPGANNIFFGKNRSDNVKASTVLGQYAVDVEEFAYIMLYTAAIGAPPAYTVSDEGSLGRDMSVFVVIKGENLQETIFANILPLKESSRPSEEEEEEIADKPVWEMDDISEMNAYRRDQISKNLLCRMFYPGISILGMGFNDTGMLKGMVRVRKETASKGYGLSPEESKVIAKNIPDPSAIVSFKEDPKSGKRVMSAKQYRPKEDTASALCICATKHTEQWDNCIILDNIEKDERQKITIYFRQMDDMHVTLRSCGMIEGGNPRTWRLLREKSNHEAALEYQKKYKNGRISLEKALNKLYPKSDISRDEALHSLSDWVEDDFFGQFTKDMEKAESNMMTLFVERLINVIMGIYNEHEDRARDVLSELETRKGLVKELNKLRGRKNGEYR